MGISRKLRSQMSRSPLAAYRPAITSSESPGRKKTMARVADEADDPLEEAHGGHPTPHRRPGRHRAAGGRRAPSAESRLTAAPSPPAPPPGGAGVTASASIAWAAAAATRQGCPPPVRKSRLAVYHRLRAG